MKYYEIAVREITEDGDVDPNWEPVAVMVPGSADLRVWEQAVQQLIQLAHVKLCA